MSTRETIHDAAEAAREVAVETLDKARGKFTEAADAARRGGDKVRETATHLGEVAREKYEATTGRLREGYDKVSTDLGKLRGDVEGYVRENPGKSILMATGAGFLLGWLVSRRRDRD